MSNTNEKERQKIVLAALLHDIGKFWQRADDSMQNSENLKKEWYEKFEWLVPKNQFDRPGYQHAFWTYAFIIKNKSLFRKGGFEEKDIEQLALMAAKHHRPDKNNESQSIISLADKWASKNERVFADYARTEDEQEEHGYWGKYAFKKIPLHSIFDLINRYSALSEDQKTNYDLLRLRVTGDKISIFPTNKNIDRSYSRQPDYKKLWDEFELEFGSLKDKVESFEQLLVALMSILKKYTWCIPSSTMDMPYSNLYEHLKVTAGLSIALYDYYKNCEDSGFVLEAFPNYGTQFSLIEGAKDPLLLLSVDLSGIQKFIYDITSKGAAKSLKGRSYYLQLLMDSVLNYILEQTEMFPVNIIYASGGMAYLILPNTSETKNKLKDIRKTLEKKFFESYETKLYPALGWVSFRYQIKYKENEIGYSLQLYSDNPEFENKGELQLGDLWRQASFESGKYKMKKFQSLLLNDFDRFFEPENINGDEKLCTVTGKTLQKNEGKNIVVDDDKEILVSKEVYEQIELGKKLAYADTISELKYNDQKHDNFINPGNLNTTFSLNPNYISEEMVLYKYNETNLDKAHGFKFFGGNIQPQINGRIKSFEEICYIKDDKYTKLGVLKMDVDNLGKIFIRGLKDEDKSFSAYATLSFYFEAFFSGYINDIRNGDNFKDHIQIIYSGGDDVFAVGRWDKIIDFAEAVNDSFHQFTERVDITLSAGIAIVGRKYPVAKAAELADEAENASKKYNNTEKNAITFFGETVSWKEEYPFVKGLKNEFYKYMNKEKPDLSLGLLHKLQGYKIYKDELKSKGEKDFSYKWHSAYYLTRVLDKIKEEKIEVRNFIKEIRNNLLHNGRFGSDRYLDLIALAARWTEYLLKLKK